MSNTSLLGTGGEAVGFAEDVFLTIGNLYMSVVAGVTDWKLSESNRIAEYKVISGKPVNKHRAEELSTLTIGLKFVRLLMRDSIESQLEILEALRTSGEPQQVMLGVNEYKGMWLLRSVESRYEEVLANGALVSAAVDIELVESKEAKVVEFSRVERRKKSRRRPKSVEKSKLLIDYNEQYAPLSNPLWPPMYKQPLKPT